MGCISVKQLESLVRLRYKFIEIDGEFCLSVKVGLVLRKG